MQTALYNLHITHADGGKEVYTVQALCEGEALELGSIRAWEMCGDTAKEIECVEA